MKKLLVKKQPQGGIDVLDIHKIGLIIGESTPTEFLFAVDESIGRLEYVLVKSKEILLEKSGNRIEEIEADVEIVAQIYKIFANSMALLEGLNLESAEKIVEAGLSDNRVFAKARVLGFLYKGTIYEPRKAIKPGNIVYRAPKELLEQFYSYSKDEGLHIGNLITRHDVPVSLSIKGFRRHLAILAQTGAGKSYTAGVLIEELLQKGATIIIIDPHADYVFIGNKKDGTKIDRVDIFRTPESTGRYDESEIGKKVENYSIKFSDLSLTEIEIICGINEKWTNITSAIQNTIDNFKQNNQDYSLEDLLNELINGDKNDKSASKYINRLNKIKVWGDATTDIGKFLKPKHISIMDLSGLNDTISDYVNYKILNDIYYQVESKNFEYPVFIFIEESHKFIPNKENKLSKSIIKKIASEGRKFGIFLVLITQRPYKIDQDALSQCNSQIIMRMTNPTDQNAIKTSSERISENLLNDLPGLNIGEAVVVGEITRAPVMIKVRERITEEGGADIDIITKLKEASEEAEHEKEKKEDGLQESVSEIRDLVES